MSNSSPNEILFNFLECSDKQFNEFEDPLENQYHSES
jgi:hypothetical protein